MPSTKYFSGFPHTPLLGQPPVWSTVSFLLKDGKILFTTASPPPFPENGLIGDPAGGWGLKIIWEVEASYPHAITVRARDMRNDQALWWLILASDPKPMTKTFVLDPQKPNHPFSIYKDIAINK
jgi:hypothetical protein